MGDAKVDSEDPNGSSLNLEPLQSTPSRRTESATDVPASLQPATSRPSAVEPFEVDDSGASFFDNQHLDGGYGWVVTVCAFVLLFLFLGTLYSWGVIQAELAKTLEVSSLSLSAIGATAAFCLGAGCLPCSWILERYGPRLTSGAGVVGVSLSLAISGSCLNSLAGLVVFQGILFGSSGALVYLTAYTIPSQWFMKKRGLATGIASCGAGLGGAVWSLAIERLVRDVGLAWTYRTLALITALVGLGSSWPLKTGLMARRPVTLSRGPEKHMFQSSRYLRMLVSCFIASYPFFIPPYYIPQYAQSIGLSSAQGALYSALFNVASGVGRIAFGVLADQVIGNLNAWTLSLITIALSSLLIWPQATGQGLIILFVIICGLGSGGFFSLQSSVVGQLIGDHRLHTGVSWLEVAESFGYLAGPISAGGLLDRFGGVNQGAGPYLPAIYLVGGTTALSCLLAISVRYSTSKHIWHRV